MKHRFHLQKYKYANKGTCPKCHRPKCFVYYIDEEKEIVFPKYVGRCDHESSCGYHYSPREYFRDNNIATPWEDTKPCWCQTEETHPKPVSFIDEEIVQSTLGHYSINPLFLYFCKVFGHEETQRLFNKYRVGTASIWNGATIYWQTDILGRTRGGKVMGYNPNDGHRIKNPQNRISWAHTLLRLQNFSMKQCFFGEHLLMDNVTNVAIVESEKTAMIASHFLPDFIWLATGGKHGCLNNDAIKELEALIDTKNAVLCKIQKIVPELDIATISGSQHLQSIDDILNRDPLDTLKEAFEVKYEMPMSQHQEQMLKDLIHSTTE